MRVRRGPRVTYARIRSRPIRVPVDARAPVSYGRRSVRGLRGFVFDLDGCVWTGDVLMPGAADVLAFLREQGRGVAFLTNNSRARAATLQAKLNRLGVAA